ncbi:hypothetical protein [Edaphocola aurantiacus]|uniref:hypothetical protein n=1 Tax=Edaphocola aurantiacus TaxID=2601682 RepID=UPI001C93A237|nr:hypothetical protein [Edaphocola aurantiacus]
MKKVLLLSAALLSLFASCTKINTQPDNNGNSNGNNTSATYSASFTFNGSQTKLGYNKNFAQLVSSSSNMVGGFATNSVNGIVPYPSLEIAFVFDHDEVSEAVFMALKGQTIRQNTTNGTYVMINYDSDANNSWYGDVSADNSYAIQVSDIAYSHSVTTVFNDVDVYRVKGLGKALVEKDGSQKAVEQITFDMLMSRVK